MVQATETTAPGRKTSKERITFLACANGDGSHKAKMVVIGKARNPRVFKNCGPLPVEYYSTKKAWMTSSLFIKWFNESFVVQVKTFQAEQNLNGQAILLVDNAPSHASETQLISDDGKIITMFLPPNCTPLIQPMDQNAIRLTKMYYRKSLLVHVLSLEENDISKALKNINLKDAVFLLANSWDKLSPEVIEKCWKKILCSNIATSETEEDSDDDIPLSILKERWLLGDNDQQEVGEIGNMLQQINNSEHAPNESEIAEWIDGDEDHLAVDSGNGSSEENEVPRDALKIKHEEAIRSFSTCIQWSDENGVDLNSLTILRMLRQRAMEAKQGCLRQKKISDFFT